MAKNSDRALLDLCAHVVRQPERLSEVGRVPVAPGGKIAIARHRHPNMMQMDLALGCAGSWTIAGKTVAPHAVTALVFYPNVEHGYAITARRPDAEIYNFKLRVSPQWPALKTKVFAPQVLSFTGEESLLRAMRRLVRLSPMRGAAQPMLAATLVEILCLWPRSTETAEVPAFRGTELDSRIEAAIALIEQRLAQPPDLEELATAAHLSPRHLVRLFESTCGTTPHAYITARRVARARELLAQGQLNVTQAADALGFPSIHTFSRWFLRETKVTPAAFRASPGMF
jgi:AraC-like DNA-binding protein